MKQSPRSNNNYRCQCHQPSSTIIKHHLPSSTIINHRFNGHHWTIFHFFVFHEHRGPSEEGHKAKAHGVNVGQLMMLSPGLVKNRAAPRVALFFNIETGLRAINVAMRRSHMEIFNGELTRKITLSIVPYPLVVRYITMEHHHFQWVPL